MFFAGFGLIARYIPPPAPARTAADVALFYRDHANAIRAGMVISMYALVFFVPFTSAISVQLKRIEGEHTPLTYAQLGLGCTLPVAFFPALYYIQIAAFRPERAHEAIQTLGDMGWLPFTGIVYAIFVQNLVIGLAVLSDQRDSPVYPRWYGYFCLWTAVLYCPASLDVFFKDGPLAWNGLFSFWLSLVAFFAWLVVTVVVTLQAVGGQHRDDQTEGRPNRCITAVNAGELTADEAAAAKWWATETQWRIIDRCLQLHGGYGYINEYEIARLWRDSRVQHIYGGTNEIMPDIVGKGLGY